MSRKLKKCQICNEMVEDIYETNSGVEACGDCFADDFLETFDENEDDFIFENAKWEVVKPETKPITIRLNVIDIERAKKLAKEKNMPYQTLLKEIIHKNLA